ncbi:MAG: class I SAM-dependent methyltransferase [Candidatus Gracilibacteria bacterium]|nr:class I SAM-dependent methyltransferase [Candidatus Gracilibacteria bacterium]
MKTYDKFLDYYEEVVRGINSPLEDEVFFLKEDCIVEYNPDAKNILELACGTGAVAKEFIKAGYEVTGLDINENMLAKATKNIGKENIVLGDMTNFDLGKKFDVVLCNYNSICHLLTWVEWQSFFEMAYKHLEVGGILVFDINTLFEFESITRDFAQFYTFGDDVVCLEMFKKPSHFEWLIKIFSHKKDSEFELITEVVKENSFPISKIEKELKAKGFKLLEKVDYHYGQVSAESERVYFIGQKILGIS